MREEEEALTSVLRYNMGFNGGGDIIFEFFLCLTEVYEQTRFLLTSAFIKMLKKLNWLPAKGTQIKFSKKCSTCFCFLLH